MLVALENYNGPDPCGPAVVYIYLPSAIRRRRRRALRAELVHNRSGIGSAFEVMDFNKDGRPDIVVAGAYGTHAFLASGGPAAPAKKSPGRTTNQSALLSLAVRSSTVSGRSELLLGILQRDLKTAPQRGAERMDSGSTAVPASGSWKRRNSSALRPDGLAPVTP